VQDKEPRPTSTGASVFERPPLQTEHWLRVTILPTREHGDNEKSPGRWPGAKKKSAQRVNRLAGDSATDRPHVEIGYLIRSSPQNGRHDHRYCERFEISVHILEHDVRSHQKCYNPAPMLMPAADVLISSRCKRCSGNEVVEEMCWPKRGPQMCRGQRLSRGHSGGKHADESRLPLARNQRRLSLRHRHRLILARPRPRASRNARPARRSPR
jgi:hypothetical protein